jgi:cellulose synthase/poly-beta-1,6-N-acetylglucosamine synthase-like glycosyltransferase
MFWIAVGFPLFAAARARRRPKPVLRDPSFQASISVVIAVRNGERWIERKLRSIVEQDYPSSLVDITVISDGSSDGTEEVVRRFSDSVRAIRMIRQEPSGKAAALSLAAGVVTGEIVVLTDVRQQLDSRCFSRLLALFADGSVGVVSGELRIPGASSSRGNEGGFYWKLESSIRRSLADVDSMLGATGPIYAIRRQFMRPLPTETILDDVLLPMGAFFQGYRLVVAPDAIAWEDRISAGAEFRRKVRTAAGNYQLLRLEPRLWSPRQNRLFADFLSYKLGRLILPHLLLAEFGLCLFLPIRVAVVLVGAHVACLALALAAPALPDSSPARRVCAPIHSILSMLAAAFVSQRVFFVGTKGLWIPTGTSK